METQEEKKVSVIMGVYNQWDREALLAAVNSILNQTLTEFEFIIYDDGSEPEAAAYIKELKKLDERIIVIGKEQNHGLAFSLNACIDRACGKYIARMDADDIALPERLAVQYAFMEEHEEYDWCGCNAELFDRKGVWGVRRMPEVPMERDYLPFSPFIHPTVVYRRRLFEQNGGYHVSRETLRCEDYEIFMRLFQAGFRGYNIQQCLFRYREDSGSYRRRRMKYRVYEAKLRYRNFKTMQMLFPVGWLFVIRPVVGGLVPSFLLEWMKRKEAGYRYERGTDTTEVTMLQKNFSEKSGIL